MTRVQTVLWRGLFLPGAECCHLLRGDAGVVLEGTALLAVDQRPCTVAYRVQCDLAWNTRSVEVAVRAEPERERKITLAVDGHRCWRSDGDVVAEVSGCIDVDLGFTPATNTLPIRRLNPAVGSRHEVAAAWVRFPDLAVRRLRQRYSRLSAVTYLYESLENDFRAEIEVDEVGMVLRYAGGWERIAQSGAGEGYVTPPKRGLRALLRPAAISDAAEIAELFLASRQDALPYLPKVHSDDETRRWIPDVMMRRSEVWVAELDRKIVGFLSVVGDRIDHLYVRPGYYRQGIGDRLLARAKAMSPRRLQLFTFQRNERARAFYEARGFVAIDAGDGSGNEEGEPDMLYEWVPGRAAPEDRGSRQGRE